ncbi:MAG: hypothetical protein ABI220_03970 [Candidatus Saccharimonadales bacterium]
MAKHINHIPKHKKGAWFVPLRASYLPVSWQGWTTYTLLVAYLIIVLIYGWQLTASFAQAVLFIVPNFVAAAVILTWVAKTKS